MVEQRSTNQSNLEAKTFREQIWTSHHSFQGWTCSQCEWNYPLPTLLTDADARTAYDRLAAGKFREHKCADHLRRLGGADHESFTPRIRKLVAQGFKPKDAVELFLQVLWPGPQTWAWIPIRTPALGRKTRLVCKVFQH